MKGNELIEKILNKEIKSGTLIKMKNHYPGLEWEKTICFNGNWFSEGEYYPCVPRYDDIILSLCSDSMTFEVIEEDKYIEKIDIEQVGDFIEPPSTFELANKINEIIDKINEEK